MTGNGPNRDPPSLVGPRFFAHPPSPTGTFTLTSKPSLQQYFWVRFYLSTTRHACRPARRPARALILCARALCMSQDFSTPQKVKEYLSDQDIAFNDDMEFDYLQTLAE